MTDSSGSTGFGGIFLLLLPLLLLVWMMVSARKRNKVLAQMQSSLSVGDEVVMTCGLFGRITALDDDRVTIDAQGTSLVFDRRAIAIPAAAPPAAPPAAGGDAH